MKKPVLRSLEKQRSRWGWVFLVPWIIGIGVFFVWPMIQTGIYSFSKLVVGADGFETVPVGFANYLHFFSEDTYFLSNLLTSLWETIPSTLLIITFSTMIALVLRSEFPMRGLARAVFFLPVIIASGPVISILENQVMMNGATTGAADVATSYMFQAPDLTLVFADLGVPESILESITSIINEIFDLMWKSGVQILLMLAALNTIPASFYEVAMMEGATAWEKFWKITLPTLSPTLVVVIIYTLIDGFTDYDNLIIQTINNFYRDTNYAYSATVGMIYCICVLAVVGLVSWIMSRVAFYSAE